MSPPGIALPHARLSAKLIKFLKAVWFLRNKNAKHSLERLLNSQVRGCGRGNSVRRASTWRSNIGARNDEIVNHLLAVPLSWICSIVISDEINNSYPGACGIAAS
jgi:hypothetical protein